MNSTRSPFRICPVKCLRLCVAPFVPYQYRSAEIILRISNLRKPRASKPRVHNLLDCSSKSQQSCRKRSPSGVEHHRLAASTRENAEKHSQSTRLSKFRMFVVAVCCCQYAKGPGRNRAETQANREIPKEVANDEICFIHL